MKEGLKRNSEEWNKEKELESLRYDLFHAETYLQKVLAWIKSDSVYTLLRYGVKNPSSSGVDYCEEQRYYSDLYKLSRDLREADKEENETRKDSFDQTLP